MSTGFSLLCHSYFSSKFVGITGRANIAERTRELLLAYQAASPAQQRISRNAASVGVFDMIAERPYKKSHGERKTPELNVGLLSGMLNFQRSDNILLATMWGTRSLKD